MSTRSVSTAILAAHDVAQLLWREVALILAWCDFSITALASSTRGKKRPLLPGAKPPESIEKEAKPPVQWKLVHKK